MNRHYILAAAHLAGAVFVVATKDDALAVTLYIVLTLAFVSIAALVAHLAASEDKCRDLEADLDNINARAWDLLAENERLWAGTLPPALVFDQLTDERRFRA